jgi:hypothetical protein
LVELQLSQAALVRAGFETAWNGILWEMAQRNRFLTYDEKVAIFAPLKAAMNDDNQAFWCANAVNARVCRTHSFIHPRLS